MNDSEKYIFEAMKTWVWSGFYTADEVYQFMEEILEPDADEGMLRAAVEPEFAKKAAAEASWPARTDCDRLDDAFEAINAAGIIALQNTGMTMSDGHEDVGEELRRRGRKGVRGYCFYHGQDLERAVQGGGLTLAYGDLDAVDAQKAAVGNEVKLLLERAGFVVTWNGDPGKRLEIPDFDWKRRSVR